MPAEGASPPSASVRLPELPFDIPSRATLAASPRTVVAYYHVLPLYGRDNEDTYGQFISPNGFHGAYRSVGGKWRQRPYPIVDDTNLTDARRVDLMYRDISDAASIGIDAFFLNVPYTPTDSFRWKEQLLPMYAAADRFNVQNKPGFAVAVDLDALAISQKAVADRSPDAWADSVAPLMTRPSAYTYAGRPVVAAYNVTKLPPSWYEAFANRLRTAHGLNVAILPSYQGNNPSELDPYASLIPGLMPFVHGWSGAGAAVAPGVVQRSLRTWAAGHGARFMGSMGPFENDRPTLLKEMDGAGFSIMRTMWLAAIQHGDAMLQIVSWNDFEESTGIRPATGYQYAPYDISAYYLTWFKTGRAPTIVRDTLYYAHRMQLVGAGYDTSAQPRPFVFRDTGGAEPADDVITMAFLRAPADVTVFSGGQAHRHAGVPTGVTILRDPLAVDDQPSFEAVRGGFVVVPRFTSAFRTRATIVWQDLLYRMGSSSRPPLPGVQNDLPQDRLVSPGR